jgi:apolipoprotein N-acyltransferase
MRLNNSYQLFILSLVSGLMCFLAWPPIGFVGFIFFAWIPLLHIQDVASKKWRFVFLLYLSLLTWNAATTWWICNASAPGAAMAIFINSAIMLLPWLGYRTIQKKAGRFLGYVSLVFFWLSFEYLHLQDWGLSWPWLTLGNAFASNPELIQWYEYTGTSGGTLWILLINIFLYEAIRLGSLNGLRNKTFHRAFVPLSALFILPVIFSFLLKKKYDHKTSNAPAYDVIIIQPNIDPYLKVGGLEFSKLLEEMISLSRKKTDSSTRLLIWPETALYVNTGFDELRLKESLELAPLFDFLNEFPQLNLLTGIESYRIYNEKKSVYSKAIPNSVNYYEDYNGAVLINHSGPLHYYHKSMLVPGVETLPRFLMFLGPVFEEFGGSTGGYAKENIREAMPVSNHFRIAPAICYESIYGEYLSNFVAKDADLIAIITNDGWWGNTPGYRQHMSYARLRAIETRRWVARSANTGISCFIDPLGNVLDAQEWWTPSVIKRKVPALKEQTFYVRFGDIISKVALAGTCMFLVYIIFGLFRRRKKNQ